MAVAVRSDLASIPEYPPDKRFPGAVDLARTESSVPLDPEVIAAITSALEDVSHYPDAGADALTQRLVEYYNTSAAEILVGAGAIALCAQLLHAVCEPGEEVLFPSLSSPVYSALIRVARAQPATVPLLGGHWVDVDAVLGAITPRTKVVLVGNPHSPTGAVLGVEQLARLVEEVPPHILLIFDEAYFEYVTDSRARSALLFAYNHDNVAVLRTFSVVHRLAGLRIGYCIAPAAIAAAARKVAVPFSVNHLAQAAALAALDHSTHLAATSPVTHERMRMCDQLRASGYPVPPGSQGNFVWVPLGELTMTFTDYVLDHNIIVRPFPPHGVRVTVGRPDENQAFLAAAAAWPDLHSAPP